VKSIFGVGGCLYLGSLSEHAMLVSPAACLQSGVPSTTLCAHYRVIHVAEALGPGVS
jgi:hypothetical protein